MRVLGAPWRQYEATSSASVAVPPAANVGSSPDRNMVSVASVGGACDMFAAQRTAGPRSTGAVSFGPAFYPDTPSSTCSPCADEPSTGSLTDLGSVVPSTEAPPTPETPAEIMVDSSPSVPDTLVVSPGSNGVVPADGEGEVTSTASPATSPGRGVSTVPELLPHPLADIHPRASVQAHSRPQRQVAGRLLGKCATYAGSSCARRVSRASRQYHPYQSAAPAETL